MKSPFEWTVCFKNQIFLYGLITASLTLCHGAEAREIQFVEDFVLAADREKALEQLVPGTDVFYFYQCLLKQNAGQHSEVAKLLQQWQQRHGETQYFKQMRLRHMLLTYSTSPQTTLDFLIRELKPNLNHQRERLGTNPQLPSELDQALIRYEQLKRNALRGTGPLKGFTDRALLRLSSSDLSGSRRRELLSRLHRPDHPELVDMIVDDLKFKGSRGFGSLTVHRHLLLTQLDELARRRPGIRHNSNYVDTYLRKLQPNADTDWKNDLQEMSRHLDRLWGFVRRLNASHNSLKAHVLYHRLVVDEKLGTYDRERFLAYLQLPRQANYVSRDLLRTAEAQRNAVNFGYNPGRYTGCTPIGNDQALVKRYLLHFFKTEKNRNAYVKWIRDDYLRHVFAEAKITSGIGDPQQWYPLLSPSEYQALKDRVDIDFAATNETHYSANDAVEMDLLIKNVSKLIVKVYEINTRNFYRQQAREVNTDIKLDGLIANQEAKYEYEDSPLVRTRRRFQFPGLSKPGVFVIDFIGGGKSSRVVVRKGQLSYTMQTSTQGHVFSVYGENHEPINDASLWMAGQHYEAGDDGQIVVPFSTRPGRQAIVLEHEDVASLHFFQHQSERYGLKLAAYIDRESLLSGQEAIALLRPELQLSGIPVTLDALQNVTVTLQSKTLDGIEAEKVFTNLDLSTSRDTPVMFHVPDRLASITLNLTATVKDGLQKTQTVSATHKLSVNQIDKTDKIADVHLTKTGDRYLLQVLGKTGESKPHRAIQVELQHRLFTKPVRARLATDDAGVVDLGPLDDITRVHVLAAEWQAKKWNLWSDRRSPIRSIHAAVGDRISVPHMLNADQLGDAVISLYELRGNTYVADHSSAIRKLATRLEIATLPAGDYSLEIDGVHSQIRVTQGQTSNGYVHGDYRRLEQRKLAPLQIDRVAIIGDELVVQLENASPFARVHVYATRFMPTFDSYSSLSQIQGVEPLLVKQSRRKNLYMAGRKIGDELRYVLEREYATKYPGNLLHRPTLLLNSWPVRTTDTDTQTAKRGQDFDAAPNAAPAASAARQKQEGASAVGSADFSSLDFLSVSTAIVLNTTPDEQGQIRIPLRKLGEHHHFQVVAADPVSTVYRSLALDDINTPLRDLRLSRGLDVAKHYTQQKQVTLVDDGEVFEIHDLTTGRFDTYDSLQSVYSLFQTLSNNPVLEKFRFILDWPHLSLEEKQTNYSEFACHELNFFLFHKDPDFFRAVIHPYLANKHHKTFLDLWLLSADLQEFLEPWAYGRLNTAERILLATRVDGELTRARRTMQDRYGLMPRDVSRWTKQFETAILGKALDAKANLALGLELERLKLAADDDAAGQVQLQQQFRFSRGRVAGGGVAAMDKVTESEAKSRSLMRKQRLSEVEELRAEIAESADAFYAAGEPRGGRRRAEQLYRKLEKTQEWAENNYYQLPIEQQTAGLINLNAFWRDYAIHDPVERFFSINFAEATSNFSEMMFALALLDLPFAPADHETEIKDGKFRLVAKGPIVVFQEQIRESEDSDDESPVLITQNLFRADDRYETVNGQKRDKFLAKEFLTHTVYGCQVVLTNPTSTARRVQLLVQIPYGSIATNGSKTTQTVIFDLPPYRTNTFDYFFYFPAAGEFQHFPAHVAQDEALLAHATATQLKVVNEPTTVDTDSWNYVSQFANSDEVLKFLDDANVFALDLNKIAFRMSDARFFGQVVRVLTERHAYTHALWAYSLKHNDAGAIATWLQHHRNFVQDCGEALNSELIDIDPVRRHAYQHLDYKPLVNARAHRLGARRTILNNRFYDQYHRLLEVLKYRRELTSDDKMALTYYLILQDRIEEAIDMFASVSRVELATQVQYDYFACYLDCFRDDPALARETLEKYEDYPVRKWRNAFARIQAMIDELDGNTGDIIDPTDRTESQLAAASAQASLEFFIKDKSIQLDHANIDEVVVNYYLIDLELLFSTSPFVQKFSGQFSHVRPSRSITVPLADEGKKEIQIPDEFQNRNLLVEVVGQGMTRSQPYFSNSLTVQVSENYGQLKVSDTASGRPVSKSYVKVYAETHDGQTMFYKDGYTDIRGRFDYTSLSTNELDRVKRFSLLVLDELRGGMVREVGVPKR